MRLPHIAFLTAAVLSATACGLADDRGSSERRNEPTTAKRERLEHDGVSLELPFGWHGRVLSLDYPSAVIQAANFKLDPVPGELRPRDQDSIKAMTTAHVLVSILPCGLVSFEAAARSAPDQLTLAALTFFPDGHPRVPRGHALAHASLEFDDRCLRIEADFGAAPAPPRLINAVNEILASLEVRQE